MAQPPTPSITIRPAYADDELALIRIAALDSADSVPAQPLLLAEADGELRAALSLADGTVIADPFHRTRELIALLKVHAAADARHEGPRSRAHSMDARRRDRTRRRRRRPLLVG